MTLPEDDAVGQDGHDVAVEKAALRGLVRGRRRARPDDERLAAARGLAVRVGAVPEVAALAADPSSGVVAAYASFGTEPGTDELRALLAVSGVRVLLPVIAEDGGLDWGWDHGELATTGVSLGIPEPQGDVVGHGADGLHQLGCRVVLVPALAVDLAGRRIGKGGGYYDRLIAALDAHPGTAPLLCAVVHDDEVLDADPGIPADPWDRPVDAVLTPERFLRLRG
ncbi:MAG: 5-formyltetrahydrofolate cyclo-ligase [Candidatus Nanopelagicales bacterium]